MNGACQGNEICKEMGYAFCAPHTLMRKTYEPIKNKYLQYTMMSAAMGQTRREEPGEVMDSVHAVGTAFRWTR